MAWPQSGRNLARLYSRRPGGNFSAGRESREIWNLRSSVVSYNLVERNSTIGTGAQSRILLNFNGKGDNVASVGTAGLNSYHTWDGIRTRVSRFWRQNVEQLRTGTEDHHVHIRYLHTSKSATTAESASEATFPPIENVKITHGARNIATGSNDSLEGLVDNGAVLFSGLTSKELLATLMNLELLSHEPLVDLSLKLLNSRLLKWQLTSTPLLWLIKRTTYSHFCAGENTVEAGQSMNRLWELGLRGVLDYSLEDAEDEASCNANCEAFVETIASTKQVPDGSVYNIILEH
jgi:hypothetical protein